MVVSTTGDNPFGPVPENVTLPQVKARLVHVQLTGDGLISTDVNSI